MKPNKFLTWFIPSSSLLAVVLLFILSNLQIKKEKETLTMKYKKAIPYLEKGWVINGY